jgi:UDP-sulfoquinovose synthase
VEIKPIRNPRKELEEHYYNPKSTGLGALGLVPHLLTEDVISGIILEVARYKDNISQAKILPRVSWN